MLYNEYIVKRFEYTLKSPYSPEDTWEVLRTPIWDPIDREIYPFSVYLSYVGLNLENALLRKGSRLIARPLRRFPSFIPIILKDSPPERIEARVERLSDEERVDVFEPHQMLQGEMKRRVEAGDNNSSIVIVEGDITIGGLHKFRSSVLPDPERAAAYFFGFAANQKILKMTPEILASRQPSPYLAKSPLS